MKLRIGQAAKELGVAIETLRRWEAAGKIEAERTANGHRRYDIAKLRGLTPRRDQSSLKLTIGYARVSSHDQKEDLIRQVALLESYCAAKGWNYEVIQDLGSGLNYNKRGLRHLIKRICNSEIERLVVNHKDRLLRFGSELIFSLCEHFGVEVVVINAGSEVSFEEDLTQDVLEIITVFSARLYGSRSRKNKKIVQSLKEIGDLGGIVPGVQWTLTLHCFGHL
ncbi:MAG: IS607 family transposase [Blastocatellia bacterium]